MRPLVALDLFARLGVEKRDFAGLVAREDQAWGVRKRADDGLAAGRVEERLRLFWFCVAAIV